MRTRKELNAALKQVCENVYFTPPDKAQLKYPCIVYERNYPHVDKANNNIYRLDMGYKITFMSRKDSESFILTMFTRFPSINFTQEYISDGVYHTVFTLILN